MSGYNPQAIEKKWQERWAAGKTFAASSADRSKPKYYVLDMFPYPSGQGLHVGHPEGYTATDIVARYKRAKGFNVMHPMGWDAFGLPAEQYAIKNNVHPRETTANNIKRFRTQLQSLGFSYDWDREVDTTDPGYYRWTQWIFLKLYDTWFDEEKQRGRAISELVEEFRGGKRAIPEIENRKEKIEKWDALDVTEQRRILAQFRLAYEAEVPVNWCPGLGTVLANEEVIDGKSEVGGFAVERRPMRQWMLRITAYAERLLAGLDTLEWTDSLKDMQRNWIGRSDGAEVEFRIEGTEDKLTVFTTRPDTLYGATYMVVAPEHPILTRIVTPERRARVDAYQRWAASRSDRERQEDNRKTGEFTGAFAINPVNGERITIWVSDYVLMGYGTGAIMAVPAHDERDFEFAQQLGLPFRVVVWDPSMRNLPEHVRKVYFTYFGQNAILNYDDIKSNFSSEEEKLRAYFGEKPSYEGIQFVAHDLPGTFFLFSNWTSITSVRLPTVTLRLDQAFPHEGVAVNSPWIDGLPTSEAKQKMISLLEEKGIGKKRVNYKIRDWLFSRQRYWGEPFPIVHLEDGTTVRLADDQLPLRLPELADFKPTGTIDPPLSKAAEWVKVQVVVDGKCEARVVPAGTPGAVPAKRELNTMPQWAGSCWYFIRYLDARNPSAFVDRGVENYWLHDGVDLYVGGVEHAVLHLLYSRFWHKVLFDWGLVSSDEPFRRLVNQGLILGEMEYSVVEEIATGKRISEVGLSPEIERALDDDDGRYRLVKLEDTDVEKKNEGFVLKADPTIRVDARSFKMSKSRGNVVNPDDVVAQYGADSLRMFEMFMGPLEQVKPWSTAGVEGVYRFLQRVWRNIFDENDVPKVVSGAGDETLARPLHRLIKKVGDDIERLSFNTALAAMMEFNNLLGKANGVGQETARTLVRLLEPFAPHFAEEVHERLGATESVSRLPWPAYDPALLVDATMEIPVQVNGKLRGRITVPRDAAEATILAAALADADVQKFLAGKEPKKKIYVKGRMVNLVV
jgi:leucyl-tRNA synthetase